VPQLAFRVVGRKYSFYGIVDDARTDLCFKPTLAEPKSNEDKIKALKATHLLCFQVAMLHDLSSFSEVRCVCTRDVCHAVAPPAGAHGM
jgi:hypothetical protein